MNDTVFVFEGSVGGVEIYAEIEICGEQLVGFDICDKVNGHVFGNECGKHIEVDAEHVIDERDNVLGNKSAGSKETRKKAPDERGNGERHFKTLRTVRESEKSGIAEECGENTFESTELKIDAREFADEFADIDAENLVENEVGKFGITECGLQRGCNRRNVDVIGLDGLRALLGSAAIVNDCGVVVVKADEHFGQYAVRVHSP